MQHGKTVDESESRVPMIVKFHSNTAGGTRSPAPVALADLYTTLLAEAGLESQAPYASSRNLRSVLAGLPTDQHPPLTMYTDSGAASWLIAAHGRECDARWRIPFRPTEPEVDTKDPSWIQSLFGKPEKPKKAKEAFWSVEEAAGWKDFSTREDPDAHAGSPECEQSLARRVGSVIADRVSYRREFTVVHRFIDKDGSRAKFVEERNDPIIPLEDTEVDWLRALGYVED